MSKLNITIYRKLALQAEEAKEQGLTKLAEDIMYVIGSEPKEELKEYSYGEFQDDIHRDLWRVATRLVTYYGLESVDVSKVNKTILSLATELTNELELTLDVDTSLSGALDPKVPGQQ